jgi:hypothetical protein
MVTLKDYKDVVAGTSDVTSLPQKIIPLWVDDYYDTHPGANLVEVHLEESGSCFTYLFDLALSRIVAVCGVPIVPKYPRDDKRQREHPKPKKGFVKGHLIANSFGGGMDINLIPQLGVMNNGKFKSIEYFARKFAQENIKSFYSVRAFYKDESDTPHKLEQCLVYPSGDISYRVHSNV